MIRRKTVIIIILLFAILYALACSRTDNLGEINSIRPDPEYSLFNILDDYPAVKDCFSNINPDSFNNYLVELTIDDPECTIEFFNLFQTLIQKDNNDRGALLLILQDVRGILSGIIKQDLYDEEPDGNYSGAFFNYSDKFASADTHIIGKTFSLLHKVIGYINDTYDDSTINEVSDDLVAFLEDTSGNQNVKTVLSDFSEGLGKLLVRANSYDAVDVQVGNGVDGVDKVVSSIQTFIINEQNTARDKVFNCLRELGDLTAVRVGEKDFGVILKEFGLNTAKYFDDNTILSDYKNSNPYVNASLKESIKEIFPGLVGLFLRSDRDGSLIRDNGKGEYPLELFSKELNRLNFNIQDMDLEQSLYDLVRYDGHGKDRLNPLSGAGGFTYLEHLFFNLMNANYVGYLTRTSDSGEPHGNFDRGHGTATDGRLTLNDCMFSLGNGQFTVAGILSFNAYDLCLDERKNQGGNVFRYHSSFSNGGGHNFYLGYDFPVVALLSGQCVGDGGIPNGGDSALVPANNGTSGNDYMTYFPRVSNGLGELNTTRFVLGWIARTTWEGEGPYYATEGATVNGNTYTYYSPNGRIYARITKNGPNPVSWVYFYPVSDSDPSDRENRYRDQWRTDYYQIRVGGTYYSPTRVRGNTGADRFRLQGAGTSGAGSLIYSESVNEMSLSRECATQEEAMYRNLQWLLTKKKFVFIIPLQIDLLTEEAVVYVIIEANGIQGIINARKGVANNHWIGGGEGSLIDSHGAMDRNGNVPNYGNSCRPGDARITVLMKEDDTSGIFDIVDTDLGVIWNDILRGGQVMPDIIGVNLGPIIRLGFIQEDIVSPEDAGPDDSSWENRNRLLPLIVGLVGILHERSFYEPPVNPSNHNYNYSGNHNYPIRYVVDSILSSLIKPMFRYYSDSGGRWVPRIQGAPGGEDSNNFLARKGTSGADHRPKGDLFTITGLLYESGRFKGDGIIVALSKTKAVTRFVDLLHGIGKADYNDPTDVDLDDPQTWGVRRKFFYGLEQIVTTIRTPRGDVFTKGYIDQSKYPNWIFTENLTGTVADRTIDLDVILEEVIGSYENTGKGLGGFIYRREHSGDPDPWGNYNRFMDSLPELLSDKGSTNGEYNIMEDFISVIDDLFMKVEAEEDELKGVRHTIGTMLYRYEGGSWKVSDEVVNLVTDHFPDLYSSYRDSGGSASKFLKFAGLFLKDEGFVQYLTTVMGTSYSTKEVMVQLEEFLGSDLVYYSDPLWNDLADFLFFSSQCMKNPMSNHVHMSMTDPLTHYTNSVYGFQTTDYEQAAPEEKDDPYTTLGKLLSK